MLLLSFVVTWCGEWEWEWEPEMSRLTGHAPTFAMQGDIEATARSANTKIYFT